MILMSVKVGNKNIIPVFLFVTNEKAVDQLAVYNSNTTQINLRMYVQYILVPYSSVVMMGHSHCK